MVFDEGEIVCFEDVVIFFIDLLVKVWYGKVVIYDWFVMYKIWGLFR